MYLLRTREVHWRSLSSAYGAPQNAGMMALCGAPSRAQKALTVMDEFGVAGSVLS